MLRLGSGWLGAVGVGGGWVFLDYVQHIVLCHKTHVAPCMIPAYLEHILDALALVAFRAAETCFWAAATSCHLRFCRGGGGGWLPFHRHGIQDIMVFVDFMT